MIPESGRADLEVWTVAKREKTEFFGTLEGEVTETTPASGQFQSLPFRLRRDDRRFHAAALPRVEQSHGRLEHPFS